MDLLALKVLYTKAGSYNRQEGAKKFFFTEVTHKPYLKALVGIQKNEKLAIREVLHVTPVSYKCLQQQYIESLYLQASPQKEPIYPKKRRSSFAYALTAFLMMLLLIML